MNDSCNSGSVGEVRHPGGFYTEQQEGMYDCIAGILRRIDRGIEVQCSMSPDLPLCAFLRIKYQNLSRKLTCVAEDNVKSRRDSSGSAVWRDDEHWRMEENRGKVQRPDGYAVFYSPSFRRGSVWWESSGNVFMDDYRRLIYTSGMVQVLTFGGKHCYKEPLNLLHEANMLQFLIGLRLL